jgi:hypothetical protein
MEARGERIYSSYSFTTSVLDGGGQSPAPAALYTLADSGYPLHRTLGGPQSLSGHKRLEENLWPLPGIEPRLSGRPVRNQTLSWLSYSGSKTCKYFYLININVDHIALGACCRLKRGSRSWSSWSPLLYSVEWQGDKWMTNQKGLGKKRPWPNFKVLSRHMPGGTDENHETSLRISGLRAETWTRVFRLRSRRVNHSITMFIVII